MVTCKPFQSRYKVHACHQCGAEIPLGRWAYRAASRIYCSACRPDENGKPQPRRKAEDGQPRTGKHAPPDPTASRCSMPGEHAAIRCCDGVWRYEHDSVSQALRSALDDYAQNAGTQEYLRERLKRALSGKDHWANRFTKARLLKQLREPSEHLLEAVEKMRVHLIDQVAPPPSARRRVLRGQEFGETLDPDRWLARSLEPWDRSVRDPQPRRSVTIGCNLSVNAAIKPGQLLYRGAAALALADMLSARGVNVGIALFDSRTQPTRTVEKLVVRHNVKDPMMPLDPSAVALAMCEIGYFRIVCALGGMRHVPGRMNSGLGCASRLPEADRADLDYLIESDVLSEQAAIDWLRDQWASKQERELCHV
jgi:hypothetical protein